MFENHSQDSRYRGPLDMAQTLTSRMGTGGNNQPLVVESYHLNKAYGLDRAAFNQGRNAQYTPQCVEECEPTLVSRGPNAVAHYSVGHGSFMTEAYHEQVGTLQATDYKDPPVVNDESGGRYIVRRLTPTECGRLQGFPDGWCDGLENENPTEEEVREWLDIFRTHDRVVGYETNRTEGQIRRWLQNPRTDAAEYKMWGNGVALPCVVAVMESIQRGLKLEEGREPCESEQQNLF